jgi:uncharacterized protein (DUF1330 family)
MSHEAVQAGLCDFLSLLQNTSTFIGMAGYWIVRVEVTDPAAFAEYLKAVPEVLKKFGGRHIIRGGKTTTLEGSAESRRIVVIEFPSLEKAEECYRSPEYQRVRKLRANAATGEIVAVEGY